MRPAVQTLRVFVVIGAILSLAAPTSGQGVDSARPQYQRRVLLENDHVRVLELQYEPDSGSPAHSHPWPRIVYVIDGGRLELQDEQGRRVRLEIESGAVIWRPAETHAVRNVGGTRVRTLEVEIKEADSP